MKKATTRITHNLHHVSLKRGDPKNWTNALALF